MSATLTAPQPQFQAQPDDILAQIAKRRNVPLPVLRTTWQAESGGRVAGVPAGDGGKSVGPFQIQEPALAEANRAAGTNYTPEDLNNFAAAADVAAITLADNYQTFGNWPAASAAYVTGQKGLKEGNVNPDVMGRAQTVAQALGLPTDTVSLTGMLGVPNAYGIMPPTGRPDFSKAEGVISRIHQNERERETATDPLLKEMTDQFRTDRQRATAAFDRIQPVDVKPWTQKPPENDPIEGFASIGAMFAGIASAFTHTPAINAMNGMAAAINARKQGNEEAYKQAYQAWKDNTQLAIERQKVQSDEFKSAMDMMKTNLAEGNAMIQAAAAKYGWRDAALWAEAGLYERIATANAVGDRAAAQMKLLYDRIEKGAYGNPVLAQVTGENGETKFVLAEQDKRTGQWVTADEKREPVYGVVSTMKPDEVPSENDPAVQSMIHGIASGNLPPITGPSANTPRGRAIMAGVLKENPSYDATQYAAKAAGAKSAATNKNFVWSESQKIAESRIAEKEREGRRSLDESEKAQIRLDAFNEAKRSGATNALATNPVWVQSQKIAADMIARKERETGHPLPEAEAARIKVDIFNELKRAGSGSASSMMEHDVEKVADQRIEDEEKARGVRLSDAEKAKIRIHEREAAKSPAISDDAANIVAERVLAGDERATVGMARSNANIIKVSDAIARLAKERGLSGQDIAIRIAEFQGVVSGERTLGTRAANMEIAANVVKAMSVPALEMSQKVDRTQYPTLNSVLLAAQRGTGDENVVRFAQTVNAIIYEYSKFLNPTGIPTDADKARATDILSTGWSKGQFAAAIDTIVRLEIPTGAAGISETRKEFREGLGTRVAPDPSAPLNWKHSATGPGGVKVYSNDGATWFTQDGKPIGASK